MHAVIVVILEMKVCDEIKRDIVEAVARSNPRKNALCRKFGITWQTLHNWRRDDPAFDKAYLAAERHYLSSIVVDARKSLHRLVRGYEYEEVKTTETLDAAGKVTETVRAVRTVHVPPSVKAIELILRNQDFDNFD